MIIKPYEASYKLLVQKQVPYQTWKVARENLPSAMANSPSIVSFSSKQNLPTDLSITEEAKGYSADEFPPRDSVSPSYYQKVSF